MDTKIRNKTKIIVVTVMIILVNTIIIPRAFGLSILQADAYITIPKDGEKYTSLKRVLLIAPKELEITSVEFILDNSLRVSLEKATMHALSSIDYQEWLANIESPSIGEHRFTFKIRIHTAFLNISTEVILGSFTVVGPPPILIPEYNWTWCFFVMCIGILMMSTTLIRKQRISGDRKR